MSPGRVIQQVTAISQVRADDVASADDLRGALRAVSQVRSWLAASEAALTRSLSAEVSFPEKDIADCTRGSQRDAITTTERSKTLGSVPSFADALEHGAVTTGHVDAITKITKGLDDDDQRAELFDRVESLVGVASAATVEEFRRRLALEAMNVRRGDGVDRFERQRRAARLRSWTDADGMWCLSARFDPVSGVKLSARLDAAVNALFAEATPDTCPADPIEKQQHLAALALFELVTGAARPGRSARPEYVVVVDSSQPAGAGEPAIDWGIPVEVPYRVLHELAGDADVHTVVVRNGVVIHAPGEVNLGRSTRLANVAQRRALRALYRTCSIPGCEVRYDRCKLHHVLWWRHGGRTDLSNLLPVCSVHHSKIHDQGWAIELGAHRELTIRFPDGSVRTTDPPQRRAA
jgi:Domain of unknown function (DUF222)